MIPNTSYPFVSTPWPPTGHYSQAITAAGFIFTAGQTAEEVEGSELEDLSLDAQTTVCLERIEHILKSVGASLEHVVKTTCFLADISGFDEFNNAYRRVFHGTPPARSTIQVGRFPPGILVEIEAIAVLPSVAGR